MSKRDDQPFGDADASADDNVSVTQWVRDLTYREIHLGIEGFYDGYVDERNADYEKTVQGRVTGDSWYYKAAFVVGNALDRGLVFKNIWVLIVLGFLLFGVWFWVLYQ